jgi:RNA recognition motif-containing protein
LKNVKLTPNGYAYVSFEDRESARKAREQTHMSHFNGSQIEVFFYEPRETRQAKLEEQIDKRAFEQRRYTDYLQSQNLDMPTFMK